VNVPELMIAGGMTYRLLKDGLGSIRLVVEITSGTITQRIDYDSAGRIVFDSNAGFTPFGFAGGIHDGETNLVRFGARDYHPETGRWTAKDPIRFDGGSDMYLYAKGDSVDNKDIDGLFIVQWIFDTLFDTRRANSEAVEEAQRRGLQCLWNGPGDAYKHCVA